MKMFKILDNFELTNSKNRIKNLANMSESDIDLLVEHLSETLVEKGEITPTNNQSNEWKIWLPFFSDETLNQIPSYLFAFDKIYILDPLVDYLYELRAPNTITLDNFANIVADKKDKLPDYAKRVLDGSTKYSDVVAKTGWNTKTKERTAHKLSKVIDSYLTYKELLQENVFIPYVDTSSDYSQNAVELTYIVQNLANEVAEKRLKNVDTFFVDMANKYKDDPKGLLNALGETISMIWDESMDIFHSVPTMLNLKTLFPSEIYPNITFGDEKNKQSLDNAIRILGKSASNITTDGIKWSKENDEIFYPALVGVPPDKLLDIRAKEKDSFDKYKYYTQKRLLEMKSAVGTKGYIELLNSFQVEQKSQIADINLLYKNIKKDIQRKVTHHISSILLSASATILSALATSADPIALLGVGVGSSGTAIGVEKIIEDWISFQTEKDKLKEKDCYILWKVNQEQKNK